MERILTVLWYEDIGEVHLWKDVGGIPYVLAKNYGYNATFAYSNVNGIITNDEYEKYVRLEAIDLVNKGKWGLRYHIAKYVWAKAKSFDILNLYHCEKYTLIYCFIAKLRNPSIMTYVKLDMNKRWFEVWKKRWWNKLAKYVDLFTVETKKYVKLLNEMEMFDGKVKYLPNGVFEEFINNDKAVKEKIILTVGRLGATLKNTELLVSAFVKMDREITKDWMLYLVGPYTDSFCEYIRNIKLKYPELNKRIVLTGNIADKRKLYEVYAKSSIFVLPSRSESWGLVILEAMLNRNYVIATDCCDAFKDFLFDNNNKYGSLVENENLKQLMNELKGRMLDYNNTVMAGKLGSEYISNNFEWKVMIYKLVHYFNERKEK